MNHLMVRVTYVGAVQGGSWRLKALLILVVNFDAEKPPLLYISCENKTAANQGVLS